MKQSENDILGAIVIHGTKNQHLVMTSENKYSVTVTWNDDPDNPEVLQETAEYDPATNQVRFMGQAAEKRPLAFFDIKEISFTAIQN